MPSWYIFTNVWNGARDETTGERLYGMETSVIDPVTKSSECFTVGDSDGLEDVNFGMKFDIPSEPDTPPPTNAVTPPPTNAAVTPPPTMAVNPPPTTSQPTLKPTTMPVTPPPTTSAPSKQLTLTPTLPVTTLKPTSTSSPTIKPTTYTPTTSNSPTYPPEKSVTIGGYVFRDTNNNGYYDETMGESRMSHVRVSLTTCVVNNAVGSSIANPSLIPQVLARARTDSSGYYKFGNAVPAGEYSVTFHYCVNQIIIGSGGGGGGTTDDTTGFAANPCYTGSKIWTGSVYEGTDVYSNLDADSNANPATGATFCKSYGEGEEDLDINAGMLYVPRTGAPTVSLSPSEAPVTSMPIVPGSTLAPTGIPTGRPTVAVTASPSVRPSVVSSEEPSASPSLAPSVSADPSASPSASPSMSAQPSGSPSVTPSTTPSAEPTPVASDSPSVAPTVNPSARPSSNPTTSFPPTPAPSAPPTRAGDQYGPETTENLVMNIRGIDAIEDEKAWEDVTAQHVMDFFNIDNPDEKAFDVTALIDVTAQIDVTDQSAGSFGRRARDLVEVRVRTRALQTGKNLEVTYNQRSLWKTPDDPTLVNGEYIASKPFATRVAIESYIRSLKALSPYYDDITSIGSIRIDPPAPAPVEKTPPPPKEDDKTMLYIIIGVCCGGALLLFIIGAFIYRRRKERMSIWKRLGMAHGRV